MRFGYRDACLRHETGTRHPESSDRLRAIRRRLSRLHEVEYEAGELATREAMERVHNSAYLDEVESFCADGGGTWDADTVGVEATWEAARASAGLSVWAANAALDGAQGGDTPFAIGRPPGHHAEPDEAMGFCFLGNAGVAAADALARDDVDRVAVFDWDVHHGNGTQKMFYERGDVHYSSIHERGLFPGTGHVDEPGRGAGQGTTLNIPYQGGCGDREYLAAIDDVLRPGLERHDPDLLIVSAGFDAHEHDPISRMRVSTEGYGAMARRLDDLCDDLDAAIAFVLEGGYGLDALADSVAMVHETMHGRDPVEPGGEVNDRARETLDEVREEHGL
ncbi:histone deacetylase [Haloglomus irregulare]|jgi:acetoin utilization deacetylase AcuC-like enzyme|uniref:Histone deacetylase n=1 Tax=Haloglomus irregulare TaxID=2234134 RepID=A0A554MWD1_9EURY|nr:histone deacetylase [Haloglomus irregulare]TSD09427.1 histone deacetylase [Haloglomus irregulare]